jgi:tRNA pseudouridine32 synthase/23S rRNA pseudouridine746 synthase
MIFETIFDSDDFLIINKLKACSYHSDEGKGLFEIIREKFPSIISVHRLDKPTTGLCLFAKNEKAAKIFGKLFSEKLVGKIYLALSDRKPIKKQGLISGDMEKSRGGSFRLTKLKTNPAITQFYSKSLSPGERLFILKPHTGKTHQLRVMLKSIGAPVLGDTRYKGSSSDTFYLQAHQLKFNYDKRSYTFTLSCFFNIESEFITEKYLDDINWPDLKSF